MPFSSAVKTGRWSRLDVAPPARLGTNFLTPEEGDAGDAESSTRSSFPKRLRGDPTSPDVARSTSYLCSRESSMTRRITGSSL